MTHKFNWQPILEMDLDDGTHTGYAAEDREGRDIWLTQISDDTWDVEVKARSAYGTSTFVTLANCKTLTSAKRWVSRYL